MLALLCSVMHIRDSPVRTRLSKWTNLFSSHLVHSMERIDSEKDFFRNFFYFFILFLFLFDWRKKDMDILDEMGVNYQQKFF